MKKTMRFLPRTIFTISSLLLASTSFAFYCDYFEPFFCPPDRCLRQGFYVGAGAGYDSYKIRQNAFLVETDLAIHVINPNLSVKGWLGTLFSGYGQYYGFFYIGGEIFANTDNASLIYLLNSATGTYQTSLNVRSSLGFSLLPGVKVNNSTLVYARLGYVRTSFKVHENGLQAAGNFNNSRTEWGNGANYGIGIETAVYRNFSIRGEYNYISYSSFDTQLGTKFKPSDNQFVLGVIYHFAC